MSSSSTPSLSDSGLPASILLEHISDDNENHLVTLVDEANGLFGNFMDARQVLTLLKEASSNNELSNVGTPSVSGNSLRSQPLSQTTFWDLNKGEAVTPHECPLEIHNSTKNCDIRVRWLDEEGRFYPWLYQWEVLPSSLILQYTKPGHLFLITWLRSEGESLNEIVLAAYRTKRALPSLSAHALYICDLIQDPETHNTSSGGLGLGLGLELLLLDESKLDAMSVAACELDRRHETNADRQRMQKIVSFLQTIIGNLLKKPLDKKFQSLRLGNSNIKSMVKEWGTLQFLKLVGFQKETTISDSLENTSEECMVLKSLPVNQALCQRALNVLAILANRLDPAFIADLAPHTPWQEVSYASTSRSSWGTNNRRGFLTDEERWARAERVQSQRRSGRAGRPNPGEAPSSRGNWGR